MQFISYSQNYEDVILNRIFRHKKDGFYVDVGACHPTYDSVTKHFYDRGWTGINIEPVPEMTQLFKEDRPKDINLAVAIANTSGEVELYVTPSTANSTCCIEVLETYPHGGSVVEKITVPKKTLNIIWDEHVGIDEVDFLKIDVEGLEYEVVSGCDFSLVTPKIIVIEATVPQSQKANYLQWEPMLEDFYIFFYFDGLNRFYHRRDFEIDYAKVATSPNVFDNFVLFSEHKLQEDLKWLKKKAAEDGLFIASLRQQIRAKDADILEAQAELQKLHDKVAEDARYILSLSKPED